MLVRFVRPEATLLAESNDIGGPLSGYTNELR